MPPRTPEFCGLWRVQNSSRSQNGLCRETICQKNRARLRAPKTRLLLKSVRGQPNPSARFCSAQANGRSAARSLPGVSFGGRRPSIIAVTISGSRQASFATFIILTRHRPCSAARIGIDLPGLSVICAMIVRDSTISAMSFSSRIWTSLSDVGAGITSRSAFPRRTLIA
jgi:hypothetical protein